MQTKPFPLSLLVFVSALLLFQIVALSFYWYWRIWWFDIPMHFAGGLWIGLSALWLYFLSGRFAGTTQKTAVSVFTVGMITVLCIALLWELFEYLVQVLFPQGTPYDVLDTLSDVLFGFLGGCTASFIFLKKKIQ